ncbi:MAG: phenylacetate--CoA ligase family protein [Bacteroidetes bacterium]|nr:phenylacetate--CoA ligase family protein [Bacteroidota bacterium]
MSFLELSLKLKGFPLKKAEEELKRLKSLSPEEFLSRQNEKKWEIVRYHLENNSFYKNKLNNKLPSSWQEIPVLTKSDFQISPDKLISDTFDNSELYTGYTSGSSGHPFRYAKDKFSHAMTWALIKDRYKNFGLDLNSRQARFYGIPLEKKEYYIEKTKDFLSNRKRFPVFDLSDEVLKKYLEIFRHSSFEYVYGYTNSIVLFARYLNRKNISLKKECPSLKVCICTSENCSEEDKMIIEKAFKIPVINEYGTSEVDLIAFEDLSGKWLLSNENVFIEILDEDGNNLTSGGEGRIVLTALHNKAMPFIRYEIGDRAVIEPDENEIRIVKLLGGINDELILPSGKRSSSITFYFITRSILEKIDSLKEFVIRQTEKDTFVFEIVSETDISDSQAEQIRKKMDEYLEPGLKAEFKRVEKIERTKAGKMKQFYSYVN